MGGEGVAQGVTGRGLEDAGGADGVLDGALEHGLVQVMAPALIGGGVDVMAGGGEQPLPGELAARGGVLAVERVRERDPAGAGPEIGGVEAPDALDLGGDER